MKEAGLTVDEAETTHTPGIKEYPLTLECRVLYSQDLDLERIPQEVRERYYPGNDPVEADIHTLYVGEIADAYIIR